MKQTKQTIKTDIKMRVTPEQSEKVQQICITYGIFWRSNSTSNSFFNKKPFLYITKDRIQWGTVEEVFLEKELEEINPELFIKTNGTCSFGNALKEENTSNLKIRDEFIYKVQNEKIGVICNTLEELRAWYSFLDKHMDKSLKRIDTGEYFNQELLGKVIVNNTYWGSIVTWGHNDGWYEKQGYKVYDFKDIIETKIVKQGKLGEAHMYRADGKEVTELDRIVSKPCLDTSLNDLPKEIQESLDLVDKALEETSKEELEKYLSIKEINKEPKEYLVYVEGQKAPKVIHTDIDSAKEEAKRLAKKMTSLRKQTLKVYVVEVKAKFQSEIVVNEIN